MTKIQLLPFLISIAAVPAFAQQPAERGAFQIYRGSQMIGEDRFTLQVIRTRGANTLRLESNAYFPPDNPRLVVTTTLDHRLDSSLVSSDVRTSTAANSRTINRYQPDMVTVRIIRPNGSESISEKPHDGNPLAFHDSLPSSFLTIRRSIGTHSMVHLADGSIGRGSVAHPGRSRMPGPGSDEGDLWVITRGERTIRLWYDADGQLAAVQWDGSQLVARRSE